MIGHRILTAYQSLNELHTTSWRKYFRVVARDILLEAIENIKHKTTSQEYNL
jgi:hypothetical protein